MSYHNWPHSLRRAFIKDYNIPISITKSPYFEHQLEFLDKQYNTIEKANLLNDAIEKLGNENELMKYMKTTREKIIDYIKNNKEYNSFTCSGLNFSNLDIKTTKNIYNLENIDVNLISIDLKSANFQTFSLLRPKLVDNCNTYDEFISKFTDIEYFKKSKKNRQIIFGNLNPKRQRREIKGIMNHVYHYISSQNPSIRPHMFSSDEMVFFKKGFDLGYLSEIPYITAIKVNMEEFVLEQVKMNISNAFLKRFGDGSFDLKCCQGNYTIEVLRHIYDEEIHPYDRVFFNDGRICEYKDSLFNE